MANEFKHKNVGSGLESDEYHGVEYHQFDSQATGDMMYASSATQLSRRAIGSTNDFLQVVGGVPTWVTSPILGGNLDANSKLIQNIGELYGKTTYGALYINGSPQGSVGVGINLRTTGAAAAYTLTNRITISANAAIATISFANSVLTNMTLGGNMTVTGYAFDAGSGNATIVTDTSNVGLRIENSGDPHGGAITLAATHITPEVTAIIGQLIWEAYDHAGTPAVQNMTTLQVSHTNIGDGTEAVKMIWNMWDAGAANVSMELTGAGGLSVDADIGTGDDPVALFDSIPAKYGVDDAEFLRRIARDSLPALVDIGVMSRKDTGSGYMVNVQPALYLAWGGVRHNREYINATREELLEEIDALKLKVEMLKRRN